MSAHNKIPEYLLRSATEDLCRELNLTLIDFTYGGSVRNTNVRVRDKIYSNLVSDNITLPTLQLSGRGVVEKHLKLKDLTETINSIPDQIFMSNTRYMFRDPFTGIFKVHCTLCVNDEFGQAGLCNGTFNTTLASLQKGYLPCRCSDRPKLTESQLVFQLTKNLAEENAVFNELTCTKSKSMNDWRFSWTCECGFCNKNVLIGNFRKGRRCSRCAKSGFDRTKPTYFYIVRWYSDDESFSCLKFGITNRKSVRERVMQQSRVSPLNFEIINYYRFDKGDYPLMIETFLKRTCKDIRYCPKNLLPSGWYETIQDSLDNICFIENLIMQNFDC